MLNHRKHNLWTAFVIFFTVMMKKWLLLKKNTHIKARMQKPYPIYDENGPNQLKSIPYPIYDQNSWKTIPFGAAHTYIAHTRKYPPGYIFRLDYQIRQSSGNRAYHAFCIVQKGQAPSVHWLVLRLLSGEITNPLAFWFEAERFDNTWWIGLGLH